MKTKAVILSVALFAVFALTMVPSVSALSGQINCLTPVSCVNTGTIALNGPGNTGTATFWLHSTSGLVTGQTINYFVCPVGTASCGVSSGTDNGWSWTFTPATGTVGTGGVCVTECEGNGIGVPSVLSLSVTAPSVVTSSNSQESLAIYACVISGTQVLCNNSGSVVAALSITSTVPEFGLGLGLSLVIGLFGLLFMVRRKGGLALPSVTMA